MRILGHLKVTTQREGLFLITKVVSCTSSILRDYGNYMEFCYKNP